MLGAGCVVHRGILFVGIDGDWHVQVVNMQPQPSAAAQKEAPHKRKKQTVDQPDAVQRKKAKHDKQKEKKKEAGQSKKPAPAAPGLSFPPVLTCCLLSALLVFPSSFVCVEALKVCIRAGYLSSEACVHTQLQERSTARV